jgi:hypothetical protein
MSSNIDDILYGMKIEQAIGRGVTPAEMMEIMTVDFLKKKSDGKKIVILTDGETSYQCLLVDTDKAQPKKKQHG